MPEIPFSTNLPDQTAVYPYEQTIENAIVTPLGVRMRPGLEDYQTVSSGKKLLGLYDWQEQNLVVAVTSDGKVWKVSNTDTGRLLLETGDKLLLEDGGFLLLEEPGALTEVTGANVMGTTYKISWADYGSILFMANGGKIQALTPSQSLVTNDGTNYTCILNHVADATNEPGTGGSWETYWTATGDGGSAWVLGTTYGSGLAQQLDTADSDWPDSVKFIATCDSYLFALEDGTETVWFSQVGSPLYTDGEYFTVEGAADDATCLASLDND